MAGPEADISKFYYVKIGAFLKRRNADSFRAQAIFASYLGTVMFVESRVDVHRITIGPFAQKHEEELAIDRASGISSYPKQRPCPRDAWQSR